MDAADRDDGPGRGRLRGADRFWVPASLWLSYLANDGEEWVTMAASARRVAERMPAWFPPRALLRHVDERHVHTGIAVMGLLYGAAVLDGWRTAGRGRLFQDVQLAFGVHGFGHLAASLVTGQYTSGVLTTPTVVLPQWLWVRSRLNRAAVPDVARVARATALVGGWLLGAHAVGLAVSEASR